MARGTMHPGKPTDQRRRRNAPTHPTTVVTRDGVVRGPTLVQATARLDWDPVVVRWWDTWRRAPQAQLFEETDWMRLATLAPIVAAYWKRPSAAALSEVRMNEERLGATVMDRLRARIRIEEPGDSEDGDASLAVVRSMDDVRKRLAQGDDET